MNVGVLTGLSVDLIRSSKLNFLCSGERCRGLGGISIHKPQPCTGTVALFRDSALLDSRRRQELRQTQSRASTSA
jgi:hypothetical protein